LELQEARAASTGEWSGHKLWPAALALLEHLHRGRGEALRGLRVLELGCGLPLLAAALAALGAEVCATDHPEVLPHAEEVLEAEGAHAGATLRGLSPVARSRLKLRGLAWGGADAEEAARNLTLLCGFAGPVDLLIGADLVYHDFPLEPLRETLVGVMRAHGASAVLALQPRRFPMAAALKEPRRVASFLKSLSSEETGWEVHLDKPGRETRAVLGEDAVEGLVIATVTPAGAAPRGRATGAAAAPPASDWRPVRYFREELPAEPESEGADAVGASPPRSIPRTMEL